MESMKILGRPPVRRTLEALAAVGFGLLAALPEPGLPTLLLLGGAAVAVGLWPRGVRAGLGGLAVLVVLSVARAIWLDGHWLYLADELPSALLRAGVPWLIAVSLRLYVSLGRRAEQDREHRRRRRVAELKQQVAADRLALAQSLHDDLGHSLSLVALNLGRLEVDPTLPQAARDSLSGARSELARAVERLGDSVVGLRAGAPLAPSHAESADALIHRARTAGARISVRGLPEGRRLADFGGERVVRILQEAITNASRHAPGAAIAIDAADRGRELRIRVTNGIPPRSPEIHTSGTGLADLGREIRATGGGFEAMPSGDEFVLTAVLRADGAPEGRSAEREDRHRETVSDGSAADGTKRTQRRVLIAAAAVIVCGLATAESISVVQKSNALLSPEAFADIEVGDARDDVVRFLPGQELPFRRGESRPPDCHHYAVTANSFDDAAGDVYQICFARGVVSSVDHIAGETR